MIVRSNPVWQVSMLRPLALLCVGLAMSAPSSARPFTARDLVTLNRISEPRLSPDGTRLVYVLRTVDYAANRASFGLYETSPQGGSARRLTGAGSNATAPRWSADGKTLYFLSNRSGSNQVWRLEGTGEALPVTRLPVDVDSYAVSADGRHLAFSAQVDPHCDTLACAAERATERATRKATGVLYDRLFVRHWDTWGDGTRSQLYVATVGADGSVTGEPVRVSRTLDGDVPSKPFGDDGEYAFAPDGQTLYFSARLAGVTEPWSTNFDVYATPIDGSSAPVNLTALNPAWDTAPVPSADGRRLYYLAMAAPGHEADRFRIMELDLTTRAQREIAPHWDRNAGALTVSPDGRTLYTLADDQGERPLFAIDVSTGSVKRLAAGGNITDYTAAHGVIVIARDSLTAPSDLYRVDGNGTVKAVTEVNRERLAGVEFGAPEEFHFKGWNGESVRGYVVKPVGYAPGHRYPVAFLIHGGPQGSWLNDFHYRWNPQTYAGAGYAVVAIDFHGSTGYGQAFTDSISGHWGDRPLEDLQKGWAAALAQFPFLAADRACALGASYGGYMVYWMAGVWSQPWKCFVDHDGVFDTRFMAYATEELWFEETENDGTQYEHPEHYERFNPFNHVADWSVPILVVQGGRDYRVTPDQGVAAFTAAQRRGVPSEFLHFPDENHWVLKPQNSVEWHDAVEAWLQRWTAP
jgi:dipeptidyl aminopeptidase/acylaminoacyl peptidase